MNAEAKNKNESTPNHALPAPMFALTCLLLLVLGMGVWKATNAIGNANDEANSVFKLSNPMTTLRSR